LSNPKIDIGELRHKYGEEIKKLSTFLEIKLKTKIDVADKEIALEETEDGTVVSKDYLRVLLRKFLHKQELKEEFRIIAGKENTLIIKKRKLRESE
jgi:hypothetical protein